MAEFIDPHGVPEIFCSNLAYLQFAGPGLLRYVFYAEEGRNGVERIIRLRLLLPAGAVPNIRAQTMALLAAQAIQRQGPSGAVLM